MEPQFAVAYTRLATISTDSQLATMEWRRRLGAHWPFLCDPERTIQKDLDIAEYTDPVHDPMIPYTLVLAPGLVIYRIYNGYWYWGRPTPEELRQDLRELTRRCRPDWDISTKELRQKWERGEKESFYPYKSSS